ncbi:5'-nucleotidase C-terminal domain-containing protein [Acuticoccus yangtzensis]|uniref:5'-nucleotidase C-terminal domain-containing protein n=1 Tax=Acuticoccus yangtzensis TaxID=1443441 RepID=UPI0009499CC0|nr:5'-nucleotidase C-terminal domain-containing protein [Acuticoccus yangtzensis]
MDQFLDTPYADLGRLLQVIQSLNLEVRTLDIGTTGDDAFTVSPFTTGAFYGDDGDDRLIGNRLGDYFAGGPGDDFVDGRFGDDVILGGNGNDTLKGYVGDDWIAGGHGNDLLLGGDGADTLLGDGGDDRIRGEAGDDLIHAGTGRTFVNGGRGDDTVVVEGRFSDYEFTTRGNLIILAAKDGSARHLVSNVETFEDADGNTLTADEAAGTTTLQLLHASDLEGNSDAAVSAPNFATIVEALRAEYETTLVLSSGDNYIPSPFSNAAGTADPAVRAELNAVLQQVMSEVTGEDASGLVTDRGRFDMAIMNAIGFDASAIGNHEFDFGQDQLLAIAGASDEWTGALFPYLSANLDIEAESVLRAIYSQDGITADESGDGEIAPYAIIEKNGETFGVIGATTPLLSVLSSTFGDANNPNDDVNSPPGADDMQALAAILQPYVDELEAQGVNKIILTSHLQQFALETELSQYLSGVDIYLAGGSDTISADATDRLREDDEAGADYPVVVEDAGGNTALIMSTDGQYSYVGRLVAEFDAGGNIRVDLLDPAINGAYATDEQGVLDVTGAATLDEAIDASTAGSQVRTLTSTINEAVLVTSGQNLFADLAVDLNGEREPGVRTEETNLGNLTADANLWYARELTGEDVLVSIKNGGGIRASISAGDGSISELDIQATLAFNNELSLVSATAQELVDILQFGVAESTYDADGEPTNAQGRFPQLAGVRLSFDPNAAEGEKVSTVIVEGAGEGGADVVIYEDGAVTAAGEALGSIRIVTLDFLASGGDGYPFDAISDQDRVDLADEQLIADGAAQFTYVGSEQDAFAEYLAEFYGVDDDPATDFAIADTAADLDTRIVNLAIPGVSDIDFAG